MKTRTTIQTRRLDEKSTAGKKNSCATALGVGDGKKAPQEVSGGYGTWQIENWGNSHRRQKLRKN